MKNLTKNDLKPPRKVKEQIEKYREIFETFASLNTEDVSKLNFGPKFPKELNSTFVRTVNKIQTAMRPLEQIHNTIQQQLEAESSSAPVSSSGVTEEPPSLS